MATNLIDCPNAMHRKVMGYAAHDETGHLQPFEFTRRATGDGDVTFKITHCGICHSDLHQMRNEWKRSTYPMVPGHEVVGIVIEVGSKVKGFQVGDHVGVGCLVNSCGTCHACSTLEQQYCPRVVFTYNSVDYNGNATFGGFSTLMVVHEKFALKVPTNLPLDGAAPLLCAGITVYSPMKHYGLTGCGKKLGVVGLGGLGHMAVKFGKAFGLHVTVISTSPSKEKAAKEILGADAFIVSTDEKQMQAASNSLDYILDTVAADHALDTFLELLSQNGKYVIVGLPEAPYKVHAGTLLYGRRLIGGSLIGGIEETQEMLNFCGEHNIVSTIENIPIQYINTAMQRLRKGDVKYRFVVDIADTLPSPT